ncbi:MAG: sugar phosphate isomerase/epimerase [Candidatus Roizmanbacteria bacterium]|nr:sugar phosphate isomerase/epimerase [Candidatus Roizmanbacteria bacterium]
MNVGIKVGPTDGIAILEKSKARFCEVWFRIDWKDRYQDLFNYMRKKEIRFGFHFWGMVDNTYFPNLAFPSLNIAEKTYTLLHETVDEAYKAGAFYVNFHPESQRLVNLNLDACEISLVPNQEVNEKESYESLLKYGTLLKQYAQTKNVEIYLETVPSYVPSNFREKEKEIGRLTPVHSKGISNKVLAILGEKGFSLCFDIGHVTGQYPHMERDDLFTHVLTDAKMLAPYTKLFHVNTTIEPLNGTDSHHGILDKDFAENVFPNKTQFEILMKVFAPYKNILYIPEPQQEKMIENYKRLSTLSA